MNAGRSSLRLRLNTWLKLLSVLCSASAFGKAPSCVYAKQKEARPPHTLTAARTAESMAYLVRGGLYVHVTDWSCTRLGKRVLIETPGSADDARNVAAIL